MTLNRPIRKVHLSKRHGGSSSKRAKHSGIIRLTGSRNTNSEETRQHGSQDREVSEPAESLQCADLAEDHAEEGDDEQADDEAETVAVLAVAANGDLGGFAALGEDEDGDEHDHLEGLEDVD